MVYLLGLWDGHDSGAALLEDGVVKVAINEERLSRRKLEVQFPQKSILKCLELAGATPDQIQDIAVSTYDFSKTLTRVVPGLKESYYRIRRRKELPGHGWDQKRRFKYWLTGLRGIGPLNRALGSFLVQRQLEELGFGRARLHWVEHHECHAVAAALGSGFPRAAVLTLDGIGDGLCATVSDWDGNNLSRKAEMAIDHSLGIFFEQLTLRLNMRELEDEGKAMALACLAREVDDDDNPLLELFEVEGLHIRARVKPQEQFRLLDEAFWKWPSEQVAWMAQRLVEKRLQEWAANAARMLGRDSLALAGGVFANVKANRMIRLAEGVRRWFVFPHMGDGGLALGAAMALWRKLYPESVPRFDDAYLGPAYSAREIKDAALAMGYRPQKISDPVGTAAELIHEGEPLAWFQGRMEYGPRALGARSILALPHDPRMRDLLNQHLKLRVWYQPFCPSMLEEEAAPHLADYDGTPDAYMTMAYMVKPAMQEYMQAVIGGDGSCRPQMVCPGSSEERGLYRRLLEEVRRGSGRGVVLNTSFNLHGEPLVCSPEDALRSFKGGGFRAMVMGDHLIRGGR